MSQPGHQYVVVPATHNQARHLLQRTTLSLLLRWWQEGRVYLSPSLHWVCCGGQSWTFEVQMREGSMPEMSEEQGPAEGMTLLPWALHL